MRTKAVIVLALIAIACKGAGNVLWLAFQIISITGGSMLGVFLLGVLTKRGTNKGNVIAMTANTFLMAVLLLLSSFGPAGLMKFLGLTDQTPPPKEPLIVPLAWSWLIVIGTFLTFGLGYLLGSADENGVSPHTGAHQPPG